MDIKYERISLKAAPRIICISDIHGNLTLFKKLLKKINFCESDKLLLLGDLYTKGSQCRETLRYIMALSGQENVHPLRGNCDRIEDDLQPEEKAFLEDLPHIIESEDYIFVHAGLPSMDFNSFEPLDCMKYDNFMEKTTLHFDKYVVTGHWPVNNYHHDIISLAPLINEEKKIIAIDGGCVVLEGGQLNAFIIENGSFSYESVDLLPKMRVKKSQAASEEPFTVCFQDRFIEVLEAGEEFSLCRHIKSGKILTLPNNSLWTDGDGKLCATGTRATTYYLPLSEGDEVEIIDIYTECVHIKKNSICGYVNKENL